MSGAEARVERLERILEISRELASTVAQEPLLKKIVDTAAELTDSEGASILLRDSRTGELRFQTAVAQSGRLAEIPVPIEGSIAGAVLTSGKPLVVPDVRADPCYYREVGQQIGMEIRSLLAVPLEIQDRRIGVLEAVNKRGGWEFSQEDVETLMALAAQAAVAIENARLVGALQQAYERLGQLDRLKSQFIAIASHELRTPLSLILLYAAVLQQELGDAAETQLDAVQRAAMRLKSIIDTMLNLRYLETGRMDLAATRFDLRDEVGVACEDYGALAGTGDLVLEADLPDEAVVIYADREKLRVVLDNLISNALKYGSSAPSVKQRERSIWLSNKIEEPMSIDVNRIFERFYQADDARGEGGSGLGLSVVANLARAMKLKIAAEVNDDEFSIRLDFPS